MPNWGCRGVTPFSKFKNKKGMEMKDIEIGKTEIERVETDGRTGKRVIYLRGAKIGVEWGNRYMIRIGDEEFMGYFGYRRDRIKEC